MTTQGLTIAVDKNIPMPHDHYLIDTRMMAYEDLANGAVNYDKNWHCQDCKEAYMQVIREARDR